MSFKNQFVDWLVSTQRTQAQLSDAFQSIPDAVFKPIMRHLAASQPATSTPDENLVDLDELRRDKIVKFLKSAKESLIQSPIPLDLHSIPGTLRTWVDAANSLIGALAKSHSEGLRARFELGKLLDQIARSQECTGPGGKKTYGLTLKKLKIKTHTAAELIRFYIFCVRWPKFLKTSLLWTPLKNMIASLKTYFESQASGPPTSPLASEFWAETEQDILPPSPPPTVTRPRARATTASSQRSRPATRTSERTRVPRI
jgi:hypothetical protein